MFDSFDALLSKDFMPHGHCFFWRPSLLWFHVLSDAVIGLSYFSIPVALFYFIRQRPTANLGGIFIMFSAFILLCGATHFFEIATVWQPYYYGEGATKAATAGVSGVTAVALWFIIPQALRIPTPAQLQEANDQLQQENAERRAAEDQLRELNAQLEAKVQQRTEALEQFIYAASHDLREPLRQLNAYAQFLESDLGQDLPGAAAEDLHFIREGSERMHALVDSLLGLSRAGRESLHKEELPVRDCIATALNNLSQLPMAQEAQIGPYPHGLVRADATLLTAVYQNLISNALKYADGTPVVEFTYEHRDHEVVLGVEDHGIGVDPEHAHQIFDPFVRLHSYDTVSGSGIGLSMVQRIVERHGGRIWVEHRCKGAHFRFTLPK